MIFYHIQAHDQFEYLRTLISYIFHPDNFYLISVDATVSAEEIAALDELRCSNISISCDATVTWGGRSRVNSLLLGLDSFVASASHLRYFINISGTDFPLKTQAEIFDVLGSFDAATPIIWTNSWVCAPEYFVENATPPNSYKRIRLRPDIEFMVDRRIAHLIENREQSAMLKPGRRAGVMAFEVVGERLQIVRPLLDAEYRARVALFKESGYRVGRAWHVFSREFCRIVLDSALFYSVAEVMSGTLLPAESVFQTVLPMLRGSIVHHNGNFRFEDGAPLRVDDGSLAELERTEAFFARKIALDNCRSLLEWAGRRFSQSREAFAVRGMH
jgi:hypothetical protein